MVPRLIVVFEIGRQHTIDLCNIDRQRIQTLLSKRPVKPFDVRDVSPPLIDSIRAAWQRSLERSSRQVGSGATSVATSG